ncbi:Neuronal acetylcholine receptor subunit [Sparganum proliferum]
MRTDAPGAAGPPLGSTRWVISTSSNRSSSVPRHLPFSVAADRATTDQCWPCGQQFTWTGYMADIDRSLRSVMRSVGYITRNVLDEHEEAKIHEDWKFAAAVVDRIQLIIFVFGTIGGTLGILLNAPYMLLDVDQESVIRKFSYED